LKYHYILYGLKVSSSHKLGVLPEAKKIHKKSQVLIKREKVNRPKDGLEQTIYKPYSVLNKDLFFLEVNQIAKFLIKDKDHVGIEKHPTARWKDVYAFLFDTVLTMLLLRNNIFVFHAMAVAFGNKAFLFCGTSGIGKSTLAAFLANKKGAKIIEDDKCLLEYNPKTGKFQIRNHYPFLELWKANTPLVKDNKHIKFVNKTRDNIEKYRFDITNQTPKRKVNLDKIILLNMTMQKNEIVLNQIKGIQKVNVVKRYIHMDHYVPIFGKNKELFQTIAKVVNGIEVHSVNKSRLTKLNEFIQFIEKEIVDKSEPRQL
jgi:hypothetical protein